ncbi:MAG: methyl-accepting chemotaxis protein [Phycisphaerales bacterium]
MALTLKAKLFLGFGSLIGISLISGLGIIQRAHTIKDRSDFVLQESVPTLLHVSTLRGSIHHSLSMHRGYMILGLEELAEGRLEAWESIDDSLANLNDISEDWPADQRALVTELGSTLAEFRTAQDQIAAVSHTDDDRPADTLFFSRAIPKSKEVVAELEAILKEEQGLEGTAERKILVERVAEAKGHLLKATTAVSSFLNSGSDEALEYVDFRVRECSASVDRLKGDASLFTPNQQENFSNYLARRDEFLALASEVIEIRSSPGWCVSQDICLSTVTPLANASDALASEILSKQSEAQSQAGADAEQQLASAVGSLPILVIGSIFLSVGVGIAVSVFLQRNIGSQIRKVAEAAKSIASRQLNIEPLPVHTNDDLGVMSESMNDMLTSLRAIIEEVRSSSMDVAAGSERIMSSSSGVAAGVDQQITEVEQISAAITQMSASVGEVANSSRAASSSASESAATAQDGGDVVSAMVVRMGEISDAVSESASSIEELGRRSEEIGEIISVINDIADQTNLLALNAAIEAARAGEHGRGFAVVADEVRKLAERTQVATEQVSKTISAIQVETKAAVTRMATGTETVRDGVTLTTRAGESLHGIVEKAGSVTEQVESIAAAAEQQSVAAEDINRGVSEISEVVRSSKVGTDETAATAHELSMKADQLREVVAQFTL